MSRVSRRAPSKHRPVAGADEEFVNLVLAAQQSDWAGAEANYFLTVVLPRLIRSLPSEFPSLEREDILNRSWQILNRPGLSAKRHPRTWVLASTRRWLITAVRAQRDMTSETTVVASNWRQFRESLGVPWDAQLVITGESAQQKLDECAVISGEDAEDYLAAFSSAPVGSASTVWDDIVRLLVQLQWPEEVARRAVEVLEGRAGFATGRVSIPEAAADLKDVVPRGYRTGLARLVFAKNGYASARLQGVDDGRARLQTDKDYLFALVWKTGAITKRPERPALRQPDPFRADQHARPLNQAS